MKEHFKAWIRGGLRAVTGRLEDEVGRLQEERKYLIAVADAQAHESRSLAKRSAWLYQEADRCAVLERKLLRVLACSSDDADE